MWGQFDVFGTVVANHRKTLGKNKIETSSSELPLINRIVISLKNVRISRKIMLLTLKIRCSGVEM